MADFMQQPTQLLALDPRQADWQRMVAGAEADTVVLVLDPERNGIAQVAEVAAQYAPLETLHLPAHGAAGSVVLGSAVLDSAGMDTHRKDLAAIAASLSPEGTLHLPGAPGSAAAGRHLVEKLEILLERRVTGARIGPIPAMNSSSPTPHLPGSWARSGPAVQAPLARTA